MRSDRVFVADESLSSYERRMGHPLEGRLKHDVACKGAIEHVA